MPNNRPLILADWQVRAWLDKRLRRIVVPIICPKKWRSRYPHARFDVFDAAEGKLWWWDGRYKYVGASSPLPLAPGDVILGRETWNVFAYSQDGEVAWPLSKTPTHEECLRVREEAYRSDWGLHYKASPINELWHGEKRWRSPATMPQWAVRIRLTVADRAVKRVDELTEDECEECGIPEPYLGDRDPPYEELSCMVSRRMQFRNEWNARHAKRRPELAYGNRPWVVSAGVRMEAEDA